jgi:hypothetical protein
VSEISSADRNPVSAGRITLVVIYFILSIIGLIGTWYFNLLFFQTNSDLSYLEAWFVNPASSSAAVDIIVVAVMASVFIFVEGWRLRIRWTWALVPLSFIIALAFTFPFFLAVREIRIILLAR